MNSLQIEGVSVVEAIALLEVAKQKLINKCAITKDVGNSGGGSTFLKLKEEFKDVGDDDDLD